MFLYLSIKLLFLKILYLVRLLLLLLVVLRILLIIHPFDVTALSGSGAPNVDSFDVTWPRTPVAQHFNMFTSSINNLLWDDVTKDADLFNFTLMSAPF